MPARARWAARAFCIENNRIIYLDAGNTVQCCTDGQHWGLHRHDDAVVVLCDPQLREHRVGTEVAPAAPGGTVGGGGDEEKEEQSL